MSFRSDVPQIEAGGNVVKFPGYPNAARDGWRKIWRQTWNKSRSGLMNHGFSAAVIVIAGAGISVGLWSFGAASIPRYTTVPPRAAADGARRDGDRDGQSGTDHYRRFERLRHDPKSRLRLR